MRNFINIIAEAFQGLNELKMVDGYWSNPSAKELVDLVAKGDLRGVATFHDVYLDLAYNDTHYGMRHQLGIEEPQFNFYIAPSHVRFDDYDAADDNDNYLNGRGDWVYHGSPTVAFSGIEIFTDCDLDAAMQNRAFARMTKHDKGVAMTDAEPLVEFLDSTVALTPHSDGDLHGYDFTMDGRQFFVGFQDEGDGEYYSSFTGEDERGRQSANLLKHNKPFRVFTGVIAAFRKFIEDHDPNLIRFEVDDGEERRVTTYDRMLEMLDRQNALPEGYVWDRDGNNRYYIFKDGWR